jgi:hypothetical protein
LIVHALAGRLCYLGAFVLYAAAIWRRDGLIGVGFGLLLTIALIAIVKRHERINLQKVKDSDGARPGAAGGPWSTS